MALVSLVIHFSFSHFLAFLPCKFIPNNTRPLEPDLISEFPFRFLISPETWLDFAILLLFYGVYFGVITKDIADMCTDRMASTIGYFSEDGMPMKHLDKTTCGICGELNVGTDENGQPEKQVRNLSSGGQTQRSAGTFSTNLSPGEKNLQIQGNGR